MNHKIITGTMNWKDLARECSKLQTELKKSREAIKEKDSWIYGMLWALKTIALKQEFDSKGTVRDGWELAAQFARNAIALSSVDFLALFNARKNVVEAASSEMNNQWVLRVREAVRILKELENKDG